MVWKQNNNKLTALVLFFFFLSKISQNFIIFIILFNILGLIFLFTKLTRVVSVKLSSLCSKQSICGEATKDSKLEYKKVKFFKIQYEKDQYQKFQFSKDQI